MFLISALKGTGTKKQSGIWRWKRSGERRKEKGERRKEKGERRKEEGMT